MLAVLKAATLAQANITPAVCSWVFYKSLLPVESRVQNPWLGMKGFPLCDLYLALYIMFPLMIPQSSQQELLCLCNLHTIQCLSHYSFPHHVLPVLFVCLNNNHLSKTAQMLSSP